MSADETGWLIEGDGPRWWNGAGYTDDSLKAVRYARREDAERQIDEWRPAREDGAPLPSDYLRATEHVWTAPPDHVAAMEAQTGEPAAESPPHGILRRSYLPGNKPAEIAIRQAMLAVEEMPAHPLLTDAVNLLQQAREKVADFVDGPAFAPAPAILAAPPRPHITRARLVEIVEGAFRFDDIHVTALRIGEHVVKQLGIEIVEEG